MAHRYQPNQPRMLGRFTHGASMQKERTRHVASRLGRLCECWWRCADHAYAVAGCSHCVNAASISHDISEQLSVSKLLSRWKSARIRGASPGLDSAR